MFIYLELFNLLKQCVVDQSISFVFKIFVSILFFLILFWNGIFLNFIFRVYRNPIFLYCSLYPVTLLKLFIISAGFSVIFFIFKIMSCASRDRLISSFPLWMPFTYFLSLIVLARTPIIMLNWCSKNRHHCLFFLFLVLGEIFNIA